MSNGLKGINRNGCTYEPSLNKKKKRKDKLARKARRKNRK